MTFLGGLFLITVLATPHNFLLVPCILHLEGFSLTTHLISVMEVFQIISRPVFIHVRIIHSCLFSFLQVRPSPALMPLGFLDLEIIQMLG